jgi:hypothetical protein
MNIRSIFKFQCFVELLYCYRNKNVTSEGLTKKLNINLPPHHIYHHTNNTPNNITNMGSLGFKKNHFCLPKLLKINQLNLKTMTKWGIILLKKNTTSTCEEIDEGLKIVLNIRTSKILFLILLKDQTTLLYNLVLWLYY